MKSTELFATMPSGIVMEILEYAHANDRQLFQTTLNAVAQARRVRPVYMERQPRAARLANMAGSLSHPQLRLAANSLLSTWLLKKHTGMLGTFLDALKIKHEDGTVGWIYNPLVWPSDPL